MTTSLLHVPAFVRFFTLVIAAQQLAEADFVNTSLRPFPTDSLITVDTLTGLEWLDLTLTDGMSINAARASNYVRLDGFRVATAKEVDALMESAGLGTAVFSAHVPGEQTSIWPLLPPNTNVEAANASDKLRSFLGDTESTLIGNASRGRFLRYPGSAEAGSGGATASSPLLSSTKSVLYQVDASPAGLDLADGSQGVFLVRSTPTANLRVGSLVALANDGLTTIDNTTCLEWLDLTVTMGMSVASAQVSTYVADHGFRVATAHEVDVLLESAGLAPRLFSPTISGLQNYAWSASLSPDPDTRAALASDAVRNYLGITNNSFGSASSGWFLAETDSDLVGSAQASYSTLFGTSKVVSFHSNAMPAGLTASNPAYGVFLVRPWNGGRFESVSLVPEDNDHLVTIDLNSGLEWLDLPLTKGCSVAQAQDSAFVVSQGFRVATAAEVDLLQETARLRPGAISHDAPGLQTASWTATFPINPDGTPTVASIALLKFLGRTYSFMEIQFESAGWFVRDTGSDLVGSAAATHTEIIRSAYTVNFEGDAEPAGLNVTRENSGVFLVRGASAVPRTNVSAFTLQPGAGNAMIAFRGAPHTAYTLAESATLDFANPDIHPVPLTTALLGTLSGNYIITDAEGKGSVHFTMAAGRPASYVKVGRP